MIVLIMIIFALLSVPVFLLFLYNEISNKKIVFFLMGIILSQFLSIIFWSVGSLYVLDTDQVLFKSIKFLIIDLIPLIFLFSYLSFIKYRDTSLPKLNNDFVFGFMYWNMIFGLIYTQKMDHNPGIFIMPILVLFVVYFYNNLTNFEFRHNKVIHKIILLAIPFLFLFNYILLKISAVFVLLFLGVQFVLLLKLRSKVRLK